MAQWFVEPRHLDAATMNSVTQHQDAQDDSSERQPLIPKSDFSLPSVDGGKEAWLFLTACWTVEALTFGEYFPAPSCTSSTLTQNLSGFASSFGVYHDFYSNHAPFASSGNIAVIGTTTSVKKLWQLATSMAQTLTNTPGNHVLGNASRSHHMSPLPSLGTMVHACGRLCRVSVANSQLLMQ
jgi:hypothetical protein